SGDRVLRERDRASWRQRRSGGGAKHPAHSRAGVLPDTDSHSDEHEYTDPDATPTNTPTGVPPTPTNTPVLETPPVPTLSFPMMAMLGLLFAGAGFFLACRRYRPNRNTLAR